MFTKRNIIPFFNDSKQVTPQLHPSKSKCLQYLQQTAQLSWIWVFWDVALCCSVSSSEVLKDAGAFIMKGQARNIQH